MRFGWAVFVIPFLFVRSPRLLLQGHPGLILVDILTALMGVVLGAMGVIGFGVRTLGAATRSVHVFAALCLLIPFQGMAWGPLANAVGVIVALAIAGWEILGPRAQKRTG